MVWKHKYKPPRVMQMQFGLAQTDFDGAKTFTEMDLAAKP